MRRWFKEQADKWAIRAAAHSLPRLEADPKQAREVEAALARNDLFVPPETIPEIEVRPDLSFEFESSIQTPFSPNNRVHGRILASGANWQTKRSVVLVHGWNAETHYTAVLPSVARTLARSGINGVLLELPYHLHRRPAGNQVMTNFISEDIPRMLEATAQAVADLNATIHWLKAQGSPSVGLCGFSLGGWLVGLHLCTSSAQDAAVLVTPVSNMEHAVRNLEFCHPIRAALEVAPADLKSLNLSTHQPKIAPTRILLIEALYDQFVPAQSYVELARAWSIEHWMHVPQSHLSVLISRRAMRACVEWLAQTLPHSSTR